MKKEETIKLSPKELEDLKNEIDGSDLSEDSKHNLKAALRTLGVVCSTLDQKRASIEKLRRLLFGKTEKLPRDFFESEMSDGHGTGKDSKGGESPGSEEKKSPKPNLESPKGILGISPLIRKRF